MAKLIIMCGYPYSGKTVLSKKITEKFGFKRIDIDDVIFENGYKSFDDSQITKERLSEMFDDCYQRITATLKKGRSVISDTSNPSREERNLLRKIAQNAGAKAIVLFMDVPKDVIYDRWKENATSHNRILITEQTLENAFEEMEEPTQNESMIKYDGRGDSEKWLEENYSYFA